MSAREYVRANSLRDHRDRQAMCISYGDSPLGDVAHELSSPSKLIQTISILWAFVPYDHGNSEKPD